MKMQWLVLALLGLFVSPLWAADQCSTVIEGNDAMQYNKSEITVPATCDSFTVTLKHTGKLPVNVMGHNWVLTTDADKKGVRSDGAGAGLENGYLKPDDARVIAHTELIGGGESDSVTFDVGALESGDSYVYFCSYPGHWGLMRGTLRVE